MEKAAARLRKWLTPIGPTWVCIAVICLIAALSGYHVELSPTGGFRFAPAAAESQ